MRLRSIIATIVGVAAAGALTVSVMPGASAAPQQSKPQPKGTSADGNAAALAASCFTFAPAANALGVRRTVTTSDAAFYTLTAFQNLECGAATIPVPFGKRAMIVVRSDAELTCTGGLGSWCEGQVLINGTVAFPQAPDITGSFAWAHSDPDFGAYESNSFTRSLAVGPCGAAGGCLVPIQVRTRNISAGLTFRVDDLTVDVDASYF